MRMMSSDEFHEAAVSGLHAMHARGEISDEEMTDQEEWWARGGHLDDDGDITVTFIG